MMRGVQECLTGVAGRGRGGASSRNRVGAAGGQRRGSEQGGATGQSGGLRQGRGLARAGPRGGRDTTTASGGHRGAGARGGHGDQF